MGLLREGVAPKAVLNVAALAWKAVRVLAWRNELLIWASMGPLETARLS